MTTEVKFEAPGPGPWELESVHVCRPLTRFIAAGYVRSFPKGFASGTARYGLLLSHYNAATVNDFLYMQPVPYGAPPGASGAPPKAVLWLASRLLPKMRARIRASAEAFETKLWREDLKRWDD